MRYLAKIGFSQSYTYFTWRNTKEELDEYFTELTQTEVREYMRPNLFANTPDILHEYLQHGGRPAFQVRLVLAATLGASYGIYSGFELCENVPVRPGSEEYLDSEKYQITPSRLRRSPDSLAELIARVNAIRREHPALQLDWRPAVPRDRQSAAALLQQAVRRRHATADPDRRQPRSAQHAARPRPAAAGGLGAAVRLDGRGRTICSRTSATSGAASGTTCASTRKHAWRTSCNCSACCGPARPSAKARRPCPGRTRTRCHVRCR